MAKDERTPMIIRPGEAPSVALYGVGFHFTLRAEVSQGAIALVEVDIPPRTLVKPHLHTREDEYSLVLAGTLGVRLGDEETQVEAGTYLAKPRGIPHAIWNPTDEPARLLEILSPGGFERYFEELPPVLQQGGNPEYYALAARYGITIQDDWVEDLESRYGVKL